MATTAFRRELHEAIFARILYIYIRAEREIVDLHCER